MSTIRSSTGLASGLDIGGLVDALINAERAPARRLESRLQNIQVTQAGLTQLQAQLLSITTSVQTLNDRNTFNSLAVQNSDLQQLSVTSKIGALSGSYQFQAVRLATSHRAISRGFANANVQQIGQAGQLVIGTGGQLSRPTKLDLLNDGAGVRRGEIRITDRSGASAEVDLRSAVTVQDVVDSINATSLGVRADAVNGRLILKDTTGQSAANFSVEDLGDGQAAADLGIAQSVAATTLTGSDIFEVTEDFTLNLLNDGNGLRQKTGADDLLFQLQDGTSIQVNLDGTSTVGEVLSKIETATGNGGKLTSSLQDGRVVLTDTTTGTDPFQVVNQNGSNAVEVLGLTATPASGVLTGRRLAGGLDSVLLDNLRGGQGITQLGEISLTDRTGATAVVDLSAAETLDDVLEAINQATTTGSVKLQLQAEINTTGTGIVVRDTSGSTASNLVIADVGGSTLAADLGLTIDAAQASMGSGPLSLRSVNEATLLETFSPRGTRISQGSFRIQDSSGNQAVINITSTVRNVGDLLERINAATGIDVTARLNDTGDGIVLVDDASGAGTLSVSEIGNGRAASDLRLTSTVVTGIDGKQRISGRQAQVVDVVATDTLTSLANKINLVAGAGRATIVNSGSLVNGFRLSVNSTISGSAGRLTIEDGGLGLGFNDQEVGRDAILRVGGDASTGFLLTSATNSFTDAVAGIDVNLLKPGTTPATVTTSLDTEKSRKALETFVSAYNAYIDMASTLTKYDTAKQQRSSLQGTSTTLRIQSRFNTLINRVSGSNTQDVRSLANVGVRLTSGGKLSFDSDKLATALSEHPDEVRALFQETTIGFAKQFQTALQGLNDVTTGSLTAEINSLGSTAQALADQIEDFDVRLGLRRARLESKFVRMETILSQLQSQQGSLGGLTNIVNSLKSSSS